MTDGFTHIVGLGSMCLGAATSSLEFVSPRHDSKRRGCGGKWIRASRGRRKSDVIIIVKRKKKM